jgi:hypothetical protein
MDGNSGIKVRGTRPEGSKEEEIFFRTAGKKA